MKNLELKHLAPYFPYMLKFMRYEPKALTKKAPVQWSEEDYPFETQLNAVTLNSFDYESSKPILRPLSDLTKVIELYNGKCLIPAVILYRIGCEGQTNPFNPKHCYVGRFKYKQFNDNGVDVLHIIPIDDKRHEILEITYGDDGQVNFQRGLDREKDSAELYSCVEQMQLFQRLFEWHFDIYGLIPAGLAKDINTLNKKQ